MLLLLLLTLRLLLLSLFRLLLAALLGVLLPMLLLLFLDELLLLLVLLLPGSLFSATVAFRLQTPLLPFVAAEVPRRLRQIALTSVCGFAFGNLQISFLYSLAEGLGVFRTSATSTPRGNFTDAIGIRLAGKIAGAREVVLHFCVGSFDHVPSHDRRGASVVDDFFDNFNISSCFVAPMDAVQPIFVDDHGSIYIDVFVKFDVPHVLMVNHRTRSPIAPSVIRFVGCYRNPADIAAVVNPGNPRWIPRHVPPPAGYRRPPIPTVIEMNPAAVMMGHPTEAFVGDP